MSTLLENISCVGRILYNDKTKFSFSNKKVIVDGMGLLLKSDVQSISSHRFVADIGLNRIARGAVV